MASAVDELLMRSIDNFFDNQSHFNTMCNILHHKDGVSLRLLEFMFTRYSQRKTTLLVIENCPVSVADVYLQGLHTHGKAKYDCFRRHRRVVFTKHGKSVETTLAQLHFFKHILPTGVVEFARQHVEHIKTEMAVYLRDLRNNRRLARSKPKLKQKQVPIAAQLPNMTIKLGL